MAAPDGRHNPSNVRRPCRRSFVIFPACQVTGEGFLACSHRTHPKPANVKLRSARHNDIILVRLRREEGDRQVRRKCGESAAADLAIQGGPRKCRCDEGRSRPSLEKHSASRSHCGRDNFTERNARTTSGLQTPATREFSSICLQRLQQKGLVLRNRPV